MPDDPRAPSVKLGSCGLAQDGSGPESKANTSAAEIVRPDASSQAREGSDGRRAPNPGWFKPGNEASLKHGGRRSLDRPEALAALLEKRHEIVEHLGGDPSIVQSDLAADYARLDLLVESVAANIEVNGVLTSKGRTRAAVKLLVLLQDRRLRLATVLGIERSERATKRIAAPMRVEIVMVEPGEQS